MPTKSGKVIYLHNLGSDQPGERPECRRAEYLRRNTETALNLALTGDYYRAMGFYHCLAETCKLWIQEDEAEMISAGNPRWWDGQRRKRWRSWLAGAFWVAVGVGIWMLFWFLAGLSI